MVTFKRKWCYITRGIRKNMRKLTNKPQSKDFRTDWKCEKISMICTEKHQSMISLNSYDGKTIPFWDKSLKMRHFLCTPSFLIKLFLWIESLLCLKQKAQVNNCSKMAHLWSVAVQPLHLRMWKRQLCTFYLLW